MSNLSKWLVDNEPEFRKSRLPSLYSDLGQLKATNPDGFKANAAAWQTGLKHAALAGQLPVEQKIILQASQQLLESLRSAQYGEPTGLGYVIDLAVAEGKLINLLEFQQAEGSIFQKSWLPTPLSIVKWTLQKAGLINNGSYDDDGRLKSGQLVLVDALDSISRQVGTMQKQQGQSFTDRVVSRDQFAQWLGMTEVGTLTNTEIDVLLKFMSRDRGLLSYTDNTIKFKAPGEAQPSPVTEEDVSIASIKAYIASLEASVSSLDTKVEALRLSAQTAVQNNNRHAALSALRSKKRAEEALESRTKSLNQVQDIYAKVEQAADQNQIMAVMQSSAQTLRSLNKKAGGVEKVDEIMDDLREQMAQTDEIGQVMQESLGASSVVEEDVDEELAALEREDQEKKDAIAAEKTQARLAELENGSTGTRASQGQPDSTLEEELSRSATRLQGLQLDENPDVQKVAQPAT